MKAPTKYGYWVVFNDKIKEINEENIQRAKINSATLYKLYNFITDI